MSLEETNESSYILLIMNCKLYEYKSQAQRDGWLKTLSNTPYYHVIGDTTLTKDYVFDEEKRTLTINVEDDYNSLPKKVYSSYNACMQHFPKLQYIFKTDDDQELVPSDANAFFLSIRNMLERSENSSKVHYAGNIVDVKRPYFSQYHRIHPELPENMPIHRTKYCSGRFYVLSIEAIEDLLKKKTQICSEYLEDYAIGLYLDERFKVDIRHLAANIFFKDMVFD